MSMFKIKTEMYRGTVEYRVPAETAEAAERLFANEVYREGFHLSVERATGPHQIPQANVIKSTVIRPNRTEDGMRVSQDFNISEYVSQLNSREIEHGTGWTITGHGAKAVNAPTHDEANPANRHCLNNSMRKTAYNGKSDRDVTSLGG